MECTIFICLRGVPDRFMKRYSFLLSNVYNLISKVLCFLVFHSLFFRPVYEFREWFFNSFPNLYIAIPGVLEKLSELEEKKELAS